MWCCSCSSCSVCHVWYQIRKLEILRIFIQYPCLNVLEGTYIVVKTGRAWQDAYGSKYWNILLKDISLKLLQWSYRSYRYLQALNQCSWASELAECSCRWQDIHLETRGEGCTMQRIEPWMKGHFVSCRGWARGSHHSRSGVIPKAWPLPCWLSETTCLH